MDALCPLKTAFVRLFAAMAACLLAACQTYEQAPLDLESHHTSVAQRLDQAESLSAFVARLAQQMPSTTGAFDSSDGLSSAEGEVLALFFNANLRRERLEAGLALANYQNAGLWEDPEFGFNGAELLDPDGPFEFGLTASLTLPVSGSLAVEKDRAGVAYETALRKIVDAEWRTRFMVRRAWGTWSITHARAQLLLDVISRIETIVSIADRLESAGELTRVEARLLRSELAIRRAELAEAQLTSTLSRLTLFALMGLPSDVMVELTPEMPVMVSTSPEDPVQRLIEANTALDVRRQEYRLAEEALRLEIQRQYPDVTIGSGYGSEDDDDRLLLGVSLPIPMLNANRAAIAEAKAQRDVARAMAEATLERLERELAAARAALDAARTQRDAFEVVIVPMLDEQSTEVEQLARLGEVDTLLLLETVTQLFAGKSRLLDLRLAELESLLTLAELLGPDAPLTPAPVDSSVQHEHGDDGMAPTEPVEGVER